MSYRIDEIEGIGPAYAAQLNTAGIMTTADLLNKCCTPAGRRNVAEAMKTVNEQKNLTRTSPAAATIAKWVDAAKKMDPKISY